MKIYTKKGDSGETSLIGGDRVKKTNKRIHAYGTIDELNSAVGLVRDSVSSTEIRKQLLDIQSNLFIIGSHLASSPNSKMKIPEIATEDIVSLENYMDEMNKYLPELTNFILPGGAISVSFCHMARTICRRAERWVFEVAENDYVNPDILKYLNRLSDYLFVLCRRISHEDDVEEIVWNPKGE
jgi:cob(I)alamin adenosyltransferase